MEDETLDDVAFFNGVINSKKEVNKILITAEIGKKPMKKNEKKRTEKSTSSEKENFPSEAAPVRKSKRISNNSEREPLKVLNAPVNTLEKTLVSLPAKENGVKPPTKKSATKVEAVPSQAKPVKNVNQTVSKITVRKSAPSKTQETESKKTHANGSSAVPDGSSPPRRKTIPNAKKSPTLSAESKKGRKSATDSSAVKTLNQIGKLLLNMVEGTKNPGQEKSRLSKFKPGKPEFEEMSLKLEGLFPGVDPEFIKSIFTKFKGSLSETIEFLLMKEKTEKLPTREDYVKRCRAEKLYNQITENFSVESFLKMIPNPVEYFSKTDEDISDDYVAHSFYYLKNTYKKHYARAIQLALKNNKWSLYLANKELKKKQQKMRATNRSKEECRSGCPTTFNFRFVYEVAFIENERKIKSYIKEAETEKQKKFKEAEEAGTLLDCQSCCNSSLLPDDAVNCTANHVFCKACVVKYVQIEIDKDNVKFKCLVKCDERISLEFLQVALSPPMMAEIVQRNQLEEVKPDGIDNLVCCPFCFHVTLMSPEVKVLQCLNPSCRMDSCRQCKQWNHFPFLCDEAKKINTKVLDVEGENEGEGEGEKQEEKDLSLICIYCKGEFSKQEHSNQMLCLCGVTICSICRLPFLKCQHADSDLDALTPHRLSFCSDCSDFPDAEDDLEGNSDSSDDSTKYMISQSDIF